jgi:hypothetical protein
MDRVRDLVAAGDVSVVLAQDRDRFAREPAYHHLLKREFEEHGARTPALNDHGDESPEGELTDGNLDQLAKYERAKIVGRSRRGKLRKAREGKVIGSYMPTQAFASTTATRWTRRRSRWCAASFAWWGRKAQASAASARPWSGKGYRRRAEASTGTSAVKRWILDDAYRPHAHEEISRLVRPEVAVRLDPQKSYGVWWFNRRRTSLT